MHVRKQQVPSMTHLFIHHARCVLATGALRLTEYVDNALHHPEEDVVRRGRDEQTHHPCTEPRLQGPSCREGKIMRLLAPTCRPKVLPRVAGAWPSASPSPPCPASASAQPCPASSLARSSIERYGRYYDVTLTRYRCVLIPRDLTLVSVRVQCWVGSFLSVGSVTFLALWRLFRLFVTARVS